MKNRLIKLFLAAGVAVTMVSCKDFQEINQDPNAVPENLMQIDYMLNASIIGAQMDPDVAERTFILTWDRVSRYERAGGYTTFGVSDDYIKSYWSLSWMGKWLRDATVAVQIAEKRIAEETIKDAEPNLHQMARIWRAYLYAELSDNFGPVCISQYDGTTPTAMSSTEDVYKFILKELAEASAALDLENKLSTSQAKNDPMFGGDLEKWQKYANSMSLRYALRIGDQGAFETAAKLPLIKDQADIAAVQEKGGWDPTTGVMTRSWNAQQISLTYANLTTGLGGITLSQYATMPGTAAYKMSAAVIAQYSKDPQQYLGLRMKNYLPTSTNVDNAKYFMDYIPSVMDPRAVVNFSIPGYDDGTVQNYYNKDEYQAITKVRYANGPNATTGVAIPAPKEKADTLLLRGQYSYLALAPGEYSTYGSNFTDFSGKNENFPTKSKKWRDNNNKRVFFGPWETYFILAEAAVKGWATGTSDQAAYEEGVKSSFTYFGVASLADAYLSSEDYNRVGTSASYAHTAEANAKSMQFVDLDANLEVAGTNGAITTYRLKAAPTMETVTYNYPKGAYATNNDKLTKIITQKYLANSPWLPQEAWSDYRRVNLPFMENPMVEMPMQNMPWYNKGNSATFQWVNIPQRLPYPSDLKINAPAQYDSGVALLGGTDIIGTPISWAKKQ